MEIWQIILIGVGAITMLAGAVCAVILALRTKLDEGWQGIAVRREADLNDVRRRYNEEKELRQQAEHDRDEFTQRYLRAAAKVEWYQSNSPVHPPDERTTSRG